MSDALKDYRPALQASVIRIYRRRVQAARIDDARRMLAEAEAAMRTRPVQAARTLREVIALLGDVEGKLREEEGDGVNR